MTTIQTLACVAISGILSGCASVASMKTMGSSVSYSSVYESPTVTTFMTDGTYIASNSDLLSHYELATGNGYLFSQNGDVIFFAPTDRDLNPGDRWIHGSRSFELLGQADDVFLLSSEWVGDSLCVDDWKSAKSRIVFSTTAGLINITTELLSCDENQLTGYSSTNFTGQLWHIQGQAPP